MDAPDQFEHILRKIHKKNVFGARSSLVAATTELESLLLRVERSGDEKAYEVVLHATLAQCHHFLSHRLLEAQCYLNAGQKSAELTPAFAERSVFSTSVLHLDAIPYYQRAMKIFAEHPSVRCVNASLYCDLAAVMLEKGERTEAAHLLEQALKLPPSQGANETLSRAALEQLVAVSVDQLEYSRAHAALRQLVALLSESTRPSARTALCDALLALFLLLLVMRDFPAASGTLGGELSRRFEATLAPELLMHLTTLQEFVSEDRHDTRGQLQGLIAPFLTTPEQLILLDILCLAPES